MSTYLGYGGMVCPKCESYDVWFNKGDEAARCRTCGYESKDTDAFLSRNVFGIAKRGF